MAVHTPITAAAIYGGVGFEKQTREAQRAHIVVATPGRMLAHLKEEEQGRRRNFTTA